MKTKLLTLLLSIVIVINSYSQTEITDYVSGLSDPTYISMSGSDMYVLGSQNLYVIDTASASPSPNIIYTAPTDFFLVNFTINGNLIYMAQENYVESTDTFLGGRIVSIDLSNISNPATEIYNTNEYISSLTNNGTTIYFSAETLINPPNFDPFFTHIDMIDSSLPNPTAENIVPNASDNSVYEDMIFDDNILFISSQDDTAIHNVDVTQNNPTVNDEATNLSFNRGIFKLGDELYISDGNLINKIEIGNPSASLIPVAINTTYEDTNNGNPFYANFRDVLLIGNTMYMTLLNQGKIVQALDTTLSINEFDSELQQISIYNNENNIYVNGFNNILNIKIYSISGQEIMTKKLTLNNNLIDISSLSNGIYLLNIENKKTLKFIKN